MKILAIETSCDETAAAIVAGREVLSNVIYSQILIHKRWRGVIPSLAKKAHQERIDLIITEALARAKIDFRELGAIAVTYGPGLAIALEVGINKAKELARKYSKKLIAVNHLEGHIYANFVQNSRGNPKRELKFPKLVLLISGGHTELILWKDELQFKVLGETVDDAAGEALDKAAKLLNLGYPGGPVIERVSEQVNNGDFYKFPRPMLKSNNLNFSFSGLKTAFFYHLKKMSSREIEKNLKQLASSFQEAVFESLIFKLEKAVLETGVKEIVVGGGVIANQRLRKQLRRLARRINGKVIFPPQKYLCTDNAAMIGVAASIKAKHNLFIQDFSRLDRVPRLRLET
jgi:N6-L-threonylcarbamoyladenine synthase